jgi:hypothetical protein
MPVRAARVQCAKWKIFRDTPGIQYVPERETAAARNEYQNFFALWKDADPNIPILKWSQG